MLRLGQVLEEAGITQAALANAVGISPSAVNQLIRHGRYPKRDLPATTRRRLREALRPLGVAEAALEEAFFEVEEVGMAEPCGNTARPNAAFPAGDTTQEMEMLLRKQTLSEAARMHFGLRRDPFDEPQAAEEVFVSKTIRMVREYMWQAALGHTRFLAVIGESGAGKTTLREDLEARIQREAQPVALIAPYVLGMEDNDKKGKTLRADHIAEAILAVVASGEVSRRSSEARFAQVHAALRESSRVGLRHLLVIEEAHSLPIPTLKHLKRFWELKDGQRPLLSVLLLGQTELRNKLKETRAEVREVAQRCQIVTLPPLDRDLAGYIAHRLDTAGVKSDAVMEPAAVDALGKGLTVTQRIGSGGADVASVSLIHPLAVNNLLAAAMNKAAALGAPKVTAELVRAVREEL